MVHASARLLVVWVLWFAGAAVGRGAELAVVDVAVVPMDRERLIEHQTVVIRGDRIVAIGAANEVKVAADAVRVDGRGKFLMPGIAEMHGHIPPPQAPLATTEAYLALYVLRGATTVRTMYGYPNQFELRERIRKGEILGPTLYTAAPAMHGNAVNGPDHGRQLVRDYHAAGYDLLKIHEGLTLDEYDAIVATARELKLRYAGHVPDAVGVEHAIASSQSIDHLDNYFAFTGDDDEKIADIAERTATAGIWNAPTMDLWKTLLLDESVDTLAARPELRYVTKQEAANWRQSKTNINKTAAATIEARRLEVATRDKILKALHDAGAGLLLGSDAPQLFAVPGFSLEHELPAMVAAGVPVFAVLQAATLNPARYFDAESEFGTVAVGKRADLLLLDGNPMTDVQNVHRQAGIFVRGQWLAKADIDARLAQIAARMNGE